MEAPGRLPSLVSVTILFLVPCIKRVGSFVASWNVCSTFSPLLVDGTENAPFCREVSPPTKIQRTRYIYQPSAKESAQDGMNRSLQPRCLHKRYRQPVVALKLQATGAATPAAEENIPPVKPSWVEDPDEGRVKIWMRAAGRRGDHHRVVMYLHKYREGKARKGKVPSVDVYNAALRALDECHKWKLALNAFRDMQADGVAADRNSYFFAISACSRQGQARTALELLAEMKAARAEGGPAPDLLLYAVAVKACAGGRSWQEALDLLDEMSADGVRPNVIVVNTVLSACAKGGQINRAKELLRDMKGKHGVDPDVVSFNSVIGGHERVGEWREAMALAREMERLEGISPNVVTFNSVIGACKRAGRSMEALAVLGLLRRKGLRPDVISYNSAMSACASAGKWEEAFELLDLMPSEGVKPDLTTCNIALDACVKSGQWEIALSLFQELSTSSDPSLAPDLYTYNTLMAVFSDSGQLPRALNLLEEAKARGLRPDVITYSTLIRACERASPPQPEVALQLVADMETAGVRPNNTTFVSVALSLGRAGRALDCVGVLQGMRERGTPPDAICCQTVLRVLDRWDCAEEAVVLFEDMKRQGLACLPEVAEEMYCCGIRALEKLGRWSAAVELLEEWRGLDGYTSSGKDNSVYDQWYRALRLLAGGELAEYTDAKTARAAIVSAACGGLAEQALAIMRKMDTMGFELGVVEYGAVMEALERSGKPERSLEIFDEMAACGVEPDVLCFAAATRCCCKRGDWESAVAVLEATLRKGLLPASRTVQAVARLCGKAGKHAPLWDIKELMRDLVKGGGMTRPGSWIYASLIRACGSAGRPDLVLRCLAEMKIDQSPGMDWRVTALDEPSTMSAAVGALLACNETAEADRIYTDAIRRGVFPDPVEGRPWTAAALRARSATAIATVVSPSQSGVLPLGDGGSGSTCDETTPSNTRDREQSDGGLDGRGKRRREAWSSAKDELLKGTGGDEEDPLLWVDLRRSPVSVVPSAVRRIVQAMKNVGGFSEGLVVQWGGAQRSGDGEGDTAEGGGRARNDGGNVGHAGRRETVLASFGCVKPPIKVTEPSNKRGQMLVEKEELQRWLREVRLCEGGQARRRS